ncbi:hypothetical protein OIU77_015460 [Salix suchowensis]|uniref:Uncharacterized protein n=1 Tax=Salix suchowensis TaxID=1278906 RepID=A0ABQ8ZH42_9ROSI|nr:hypothetical protein OIU77_015460 [Salix suchowensis]
MDLLQEIDDYMKETINESLGLPVSARTLQLKLRIYKDAYFRLRDQHLHLLSKFRQNDILIDRAKAEANMNAAAIKKKFVEENQRLAAECANLGYSSKSPCWGRKRFKSVLSVGLVISYLKDPNKFVG